MFSSGRGTPVGNAVFPVLKLTGNPERYTMLESMLDFNAGVVLRGADLDETGEALTDLLLRKLNGEETKSEINRNREYTTPSGGLRGETE